MPAYSFFRLNLKTKQGFSRLGLLRLRRQSTTLLSVNLFDLAATLTVRNGGTVTDTRGLIGNVTGLSSTGWVTFPIKSSGSTRLDRSKT
jgi:hypothetical protein